MFAKLGETLDIFYLPQKSGCPLLTNGKHPTCYTWPFIQNLVGNVTQVHQLMSLYSGGLGGLYSLGFSTRGWEVSAPRQEKLTQINLIPLGWGWNQINYVLLQKKSVKMLKAAGQSGVQRWPICLEAADPLWNHWVMYDFSTLEILQPPLLVTKKETWGL